MIRFRYFFLLLLAGLCFNVNVQPSPAAVRPEQKPAFNELMHAAPEAEGISSKDILRFVEAAGKSKTEFHSFMLLRHGKVISEGWWNPYAGSLKHTMYSVSKSFTATAIGFAVSENRLTVNDKVVSFFPNDLPDSVNSYLANLTVKDLLTMSGGNDPDPTFSVVMKDSNWIKAFLALPIVHQPGTTFLYNTLGTYMLSAIVQKVTGEKLLDYLQPRLFSPLGIEGIDWEQDPQGINTGGWGLRLKTADMAKFGQLFLQKGNWNGKQILPAKWIDEASTMKIIQHPGLPQTKKDSSDWEQGYCYQMWRCRHNAFRADGAFGQFIIILPEEDAVIAMTAETADMQDEINLVWKYLLPAFQKDKLPADKKSYATLKQKLSSLSLAGPVYHDTVSRIQPGIDGKTFTFPANEKNIKSISFHFSGKKCLVTLKNDTADYSLAFGLNGWEKGQTSKRGPNLVFTPKFNFATFRSSAVAGKYRWKNDTTLELKLRYVESPHTEISICHFDGNKIRISTENSFDYGRKRTELEGTR